MGKTCKRKRVRKMADGSYNQKDIEHNAKCAEKNMIKDNPWMMDKSFTKKFYPKITKRRSKNNKTKQRKQKYYNRNKKRTIRKSKAVNEDEIYLEYRDGKSNKFWKITKMGTKIKTNWGKIGTDGSSQEKDYGDKVDKEFNKLVSSKKKKGYKETKGGLFSGYLEGYNKELESLWKDMSNANKLILILKDKSYKIIKIKRSNYDLEIEKYNNDPNIKNILTAGNSYDGYIQLYSKAQNKSIDEVLKNYKKYWNHKMSGKLLIC